MTGSARGPQDGARNPEVSAAAAKLGETEAPRAPRPAGPGSEVRRARPHPLARPRRPRPAEPRFLACAGPGTPRPPAPRAGGSGVPGFRGSGRGERGGVSPPSWATPDHVLRRDPATASSAVNSL